MTGEQQSWVFGGAGQAGSGTPWRTLGEITARALAPLGYEIKIDGRVYGVANPRMMADGAVDFAGGFAQRVQWAYRGIHDYSNEPPRSNLRILASIEFPSWLGVAVRSETGITDLAQIRRRRLPVRIRGGTDKASQLIWQHHGLSREQIEAWGGRFPPPPPPPGYPQDTDRSVRGGEFDLIMDNVYAAYTPEAQHWVEASILFNLRFLPLPPELIQRICTELGGTPGALPVRLLRGVTEAVPTVQRPPQVIYARADLPDDFAYVVARALDEHRELFRLTHMPLSYDPHTVAQDTGVPLHPGAHRYYREMGYPIAQSRL